MNQEKPYKYGVFSIYHTSIVYVLIVRIIRFKPLSPPLNGGENGSVKWGMKKYAGQQKKIKAIDAKMLENRFYKRY